MATEFIAKAVTPEGLVFRKPVTFYPPIFLFLFIFFNL